MTIRPATHEDIDAVLALWAVGRTEHAATEDRRVDVERVLDHAPGALIVAEEDGAVVGTVIAGSDGWRGSLWRLRCIRGTAGVGWPRRWSAPPRSA